MMVKFRKVRSGMVDGNTFSMIMIGAFIVLMVVLGIILLSGKGAFLIAGYNTMSENDKKKYNEEALCKFMGKMMFALSFSMLFWIASIAYDMNFLFVIGLILFMGKIIFMLIYMNSGNRFKNET